MMTYDKPWQKGAYITRQTLIRNIEDPIIDLSDHHWKMMVSHQAYQTAWRFDGGNDARKIRYATWETQTGTKMCRDHFIAPTFMWNCLLDDHQDYIYDEEKFFEIYSLVQMQVGVTNRQNHDVKYENDKEKGYRIHELTIDKYKKYTWWDKETGSFVDENTFPLEEKIPEFFTNYEKKFLVENF
jgi:hypothetical protein